MMNTKQTLYQKKAEVQFRAIIATQHRGESQLFPEEYNQEEMDSEHEKRIDRTITDFRKLATQNIPFSPFLEIGAEYGLRSSLLSNQFGAVGAALDIAEAPLKETRRYAVKFKLKPPAFSVVADAHQLPFADNSFSFVFCYQTLHHFSDPQPIMKEIMRVLIPGGFFYVNEEPITQGFNLNLFRRPTKQQGILKLLRKIWLLPFISTIGKTEVDYGIHEGTFTYKEWQKILSPFILKRLELSAFPIGTLSQWSDTEYIAKVRPNYVSRFLLYILGGGISALCQKPGVHPKKSTLPSIKFICPDCRHLLKKAAYGFYCAACKTKKLRKKSIIRLLPAQLEKDLYGKSR